MEFRTDETVEDNDGRANAPVGKGSRKFQFGLGSMLITVSAIAVLLWLGPMLLGRVLFGTGPVWFRSLPDELKMLIDAVPEEAREDIRGVKAYCVADFFDTEYVWRLNISVQAYDSSKKAFNAMELPALDPSESFWRQPPRWWDPDVQTDAEYVVWLGLPPEVITMYDKQNKVLYGYSQNDFLLHFKQERD